MSIVDKIKQLGKEKIKFTKKMDYVFTVRNYLSKEYLIETLFNFEKLVMEAKQDGTHALVYDISDKYHLIIIIAINDEIRIVTVFKTSKVIQKLIEKYGGYYYVKKLP